MAGLDWSILRDAGPVDIAGNFARGYKIADEIISSIQQKQALGALAQDPDDRNALAALYRANPAMAADMETMNMKRHEYAREGRARNALSGIVGTIGAQQFKDFAPQPNAISGLGLMPEPSIQADVARGPLEPVIDAAVSRETPGSAINAPTMTGDPAPGPDGPPPAGNEGDIVVTAKRAQAPETVTPDLAPQWQAFAEADPEGAMKMLITRQNLNKKQAVALGAQYDIIGRLATAVTDQESLDKAIAYAEGLGLDTAQVPRQYTPEVVERMRYLAMTGKEAVKTAHDISDDEIDNERADAALKLRERIANQASADRRRGQDVTDRRGRRGQDISAETARRGQDKRPAPKGGKATGPARPRNKAEFDALPSGTEFVDPKGVKRIKP